MVKGSINVKTIKGKEYYVHQFRENGKMKNRTLNKDEAYGLGFDLLYSKRNDLDELKNHQFKTLVNIGSTLYSLLPKYSAYKHRYAFTDIKEFLHDENSFGKVLALYGLRRTGKTTLIFQTILDMSLVDYSKTAYIKINEGDTFTSLLDDLNFLTIHGFKYIYIDEVTLLHDFLSLSSTLSDIYGLKSKIVLSGTDSLGFVISQYHELYDRIKLVHTTFISYKEFSEVLGINSIDTYIEYGGTMSMEGVNYNNVKLSNGELVNEYVDSAIAHNIEHSLKYYNDGSHFSSLYPLYEKGELTNVINRLIEDTNHRFAISVIESTFKSHDYGSLKNLLKKEKDEILSSALDDVDEDILVKAFMKELDILNKEEQTHQIDENVLKEIDAYLDYLDLCKEIDVINTSSFAVERKKTFIIPGLRYAQAKALLHNLMEQESIRALPYPIKLAVESKLLSDIKGRMLEEIVLYQTSLNNKDTFKLLFPIGEYDMVTLNLNDRTSSIYEIKYSLITDKRQYHLLKDEKCNDIIERAYFPIKDRIVLYRGKKQIVDDIKYINVEEFLKA